MEQLFEQVAIVAMPRLRDVAKSLGMTASNVAAILRRAGYHVERKRNLTLSTEHLSVLENKYFEAVSKWAQRMRIKVKEGKNTPQDFLDTFGACLAEYNDEPITYAQFESWKLSEDNIRTIFRGLIFSYPIPARHDQQFQRAVLKILRSRLVTFVVNARALILTKLSPTLFFSYQGEDDHHGETPSILDFCVMEISFALEVFSNYFFNTTMKLTRDEKNRSFKRTNHTMQFAG